MDGSIARAHSTPQTVKWLEDHYKLSEGISIPRSVIYMHYVQFCTGRLMRPVNAASFGKIVRQKFPGLTSRRLGTRGLSRYHYNGLGLKWEAELLTHISPSNNGFHFNLDFGRGLTIKMTVSKDVDSQLNTYQAFPSKDILNRLPVNVPRELAEQLFVLYTEHSVKLVDSATAAPTYSNAIRCVENFWDTFPSTLTPLLRNNAVISLLGVVDTIAYRSIHNAVIPSCLLGEVPITRAENLLLLAQNLVSCLSGSSTISSANLWRLKIHWAKIFQYTVQRLSELNQICWTLNEIFKDDTAQGQMMQDWRKVDMILIIAELGFILDTLPNSSYYEEVIWTQWTRFEGVLRSSVSVCTVRAWMHVFIHPCVTEYIVANKHANITFGCFKKSASRVLLLWSAVGSRILRELTLSVAESFGAFNYLYQIMSDYGAHLMESLIVDDQLHALQANIEIGNQPELADSTVNGISMCNSNCPCSSSTELYSQESHQLNTASVIGRREGAASGPGNLCLAHTGLTEFEAFLALKFTDAPNQSEEGINTPCTSASCQIEARHSPFPFEIHDRGTATTRICKSEARQFMRVVSDLGGEGLSPGESILSPHNEPVEIEEIHDPVPGFNFLDNALLQAAAVPAHSFQTLTLGTQCGEANGASAEDQNMMQSSAFDERSSSSFPQYFETEEAVFFLHKALEAGWSWVTSGRNEGQSNSNAVPIVDEAQLSHETENDDAFNY